MSQQAKPVALIVGVGSGLSASLARLLSDEGYDIHLAARDVDKLSDLAEESKATLHVCDASDAAQVAALFETILNPLRVVVYNPSQRVRGAITDVNPEEVRKAIEVTAFGAFLVGQQATRRMLAQDPENGCRGTILFTGASAGVKGFPQSAPFAMGKFAQRGLSQSMSRELHPQGIHVAWVNIDGGIRNQSRPERIDPADNPDSMLDPTAIAVTYLSVIKQHRSAWSEEITLRPWVEKF